MGTQLMMSYVLLCSRVVWLTYAFLPFEGGVKVGLEGGVHAELALRHRELGEHVGDGRRLLLGLGLLNKSRVRYLSDPSLYGGMPGILVARRKYLIRRTGP